MSPWLRTLFAALGILQNIPILQKVLISYRDRLRKFAVSKEEWMKRDRAQHVRKAFDEVFATYRNGPALLNILFEGNYPIPSASGENDRMLATMHLAKHKYLPIRIENSNATLRVVFALFELLKKAPVLREKIANYKENQRRVIELRDKCIQKKFKENIFGALMDIERSITDHLSYLSIIRDYEEDEITIDQKVSSAAWSYGISCKQIQTTRNMLISDLHRSYEFYLVHMNDNEKILRECFEEQFYPTAY